MTHVSRRSMLFASSTLLTGAALFAVAGCATGTTTATGPTIAADATLLANALASLQTLIPPGSQEVFAQVVTAAEAVAKDATTLATATGSTAIGAGSDIISLITSVAPAVIGLFPGGGTAVAIAQAALALLPELASMLGLVKYAKSSVPVTTTPTAARALLAPLPRSPFFGA
jgi:hypothetical protein